MKTSHKATEGADLDRTNTKLHFNKNAQKSLKKQPSIYKVSADQPRDIESDFFGSGQLLGDKTAQSPQVVDGFAELDNLLLGSNTADQKDQSQPPPQKSFFDVIDQMKIL